MLIPNVITISEANLLIRPCLCGWAARRLPAEHPELAEAVRRLLKANASPATIEVSIHSTTADRQLARLARYYAESLVPKNKE
jgi:hypothetical protein